ncbi:DUF21 domain-containing protein At4g33700-like [Hibiscus syriacus]|uniref:DUF21 domain-containing protein At4g33700-like n=1 Tax=Hibiscus syriacus TaxID=106335 RepID=UPI0019240B8E|nr:DUF21 domain-containing protein At4g33700-like [Hibiscus syriacus]
MHDETTIITGALELTEKEAKDAMTPISETFSIDNNAKLDSYDFLLSVKNLLTVHPVDELPVKSVTIRRIPRYLIQQQQQQNPIPHPLFMPACHFDIYCLILFSLSVCFSLKIGPLPEVKVDIDGEKQPQDNALRRKRSLKKWKSFPATPNSFKSGPRSRKWSKDMDSEILHLNGNPPPTLPEEEGSVAIITIEDVIEELFYRRRSSTRRTIITRTHDNRLALL